MQHALPELEQIQFDIEALQRKRDRMVKALREVGYRCNIPEGTFYCMVRSPVADDRAFVEMLAERDVYCIPDRCRGRKATSGYL